MWKIWIAKDIAFGHNMWLGYKIKYSIVFSDQRKYLETTTLQELIQGII